MNDEADVVTPSPGPDANIIWVSLAFTLCQTLMFPIVGRLSDIFGRRWFYISGNVTAVVGLLICGRASTVSMLIAGVWPTDYIWFLLDH